MRKFEVCKNDNCKRKNYYDDSIRKTPVVCPYCGKRYDGKETEFHTDTNPKAKYSTHYQAKWHCNECGDKGIAWVRKKATTIECTNCGKSLDRWMFSKIDPKGLVKKIWKNESHIDRLERYQLKPKRHRIECRNCGLYNFYYEVKPEVCSDCGEQLEDQNVAYDAF